MHIKHTYYILKNKRFKYKNFVYNREDSNGTKLLNEAELFFPSRMNNCHCCRPACSKLPREKAQTVLLKRSHRLNRVTPGDAPVSSDNHRKFIRLETSTATRY